jgi:hypothetical protein
MNFNEFMKSVSAGDRLDLVKTNEYFSTLTEEGQKVILDWLSESLMTKMEGEGMYTGAHFDHTFIAFTLRLINEGTLWRRGPHRRIEGTPNKCYDNCLSLVDDKNIIYMGYALAKREYIWLSHAWLVAKRNNQLIETTPIEWLAYFGVPVTSDELMHITTENLPKNTPHSTNMKPFHDSMCLARLNQHQ